MVSTVKLGADGKESALLVRRGALRWICLLATVLVFGCCGAWFVYESRLEHQFEMSRLTRLIRSTGERVQSLRRVSDRLNNLADHGEFGEIKEKLVQELKLGSEVHNAQEEHTRAQAAMMKRGMPTDEHAAAADQAAKQVPVDMQRAMLAEFRMKGQFLVWSTTMERETAWRKSPNFGKSPNKAVENEVDDIEDRWEDGELDTSTLVSWLRGNVSAGKYPPPVNVLSGIAGYLEDITGVSAALHTREPRICPTRPPNISALRSVGRVTRPACLSSMTPAKSPAVRTRKLLPPPKQRCSEWWRSLATRWRGTRIRHPPLSQSTPR